MSLLATSATRVAVRSGTQLAQRRFINYIPQSVKPHTSVEHLPFNYLNKKAFTYKFVAYLGFGFALPWVAVGWQWYKPGGFKNP
ncbi:hypothetical protein BDZ89DRAFT_1056676 [Hymenopellis radicata]|nr:hypothetical protein BDZ89DRAFT_1056676 [Hymenopellis radicata]